MAICSFIGCPADAASEVKRVSSYISSIEGGHGAVRDCIEHILKEQGIWEVVIGKAFGAGV